MIPYDRSAFGLNLIFRVHGSAAYRSAIPGLLSVIVLILIRYFRNGDGTFSAASRDEDDLRHPYAIGILVASTSFLIVFRASQGYNRYWESAGAIHHMMSKWLDATIHTGCYHMQCAHYDAIKPPSFFDYPELNAYFLTRDRERYYDESQDIRKDILNDLDNNDGHISEEEQFDAVEDVLSDDQQRKHVVAPQASTSTGETAESATATSTTPGGGMGSKRKNSKEGGDYFNVPRGSRTDEHNTVVDRAVLKSIHPLQVNSAKSYKVRSDRLKRNFSYDSPDIHTSSGRTGGGTTVPGNGVPIPLSGAPRLDGNWGKLFPDRKATYYQPKDTDPSSPNYLNNVPSFASFQGGRTPSLFLQELTHLCSLMNAVALSTLRNDIEGSTSPLGVYKPGSPWPEVDPDQVDSKFLHGNWYSKMWDDFKMFLGYGRTPEQRTRYNAARPLEVLGGVSDAEIRFLQMARGPSAKTQLCWYWITEFIIREHLNGSTGKVGPPIISRIIQFLSDGMIHYNHARKIMFIPFPFPHAQISVIFIIISIPAVAFLMDQYADNIILGAILSFTSVACLSGIHEVARELENPFRNVPNEIPVVTFQAQFNEALIVMYSGYHPDHFWDPTKHDHHPSEPPRPTRSRYRGSTRSPRGSLPAGALSAKAASSAVSPKRESMPIRPMPISPKRTSSVGNKPKAIPIPAAASRAKTMPGSLPITNSSGHDENGAKADKEEFAKIQAKMQEYGNEIERLRSLLEKSEEKKSD